ncbi:uncharacterized protein LOC109854986 isoform X1 [Pseudomyrmex gracilis]|uniref:uncharacterized protein LOC109854986 isoform X1 n=1 Tax=Pseudomyrmex gracilis TaxID=219809 RepID=UPI000994BEE5|nr:uncharacterized protein LOC109854986 isoform X1 [Pseudomyrmex gracilis]XP_020284285.1 uncharacterized protein LOC109854986 isoform X1 [Pseudomyrmex gracilis]
MKSWVILALPWLIMSLTWTWTLAQIIEIAETRMSEDIVPGTDQMKGQLSDTNLKKNCKSNEWVLTNTTLQWNNRTTYLNSSITYNKPGQPMYTIHITTSDCENLISCSGIPHVWVEGVDCNARNVSKTYSGICNDAKVAGNRELQKKWLISRYGMLIGNIYFILITCLNPDDNY